MIHITPFFIGWILGILQPAQGIEAIQKIFGLAGALHSGCHHIAQAQDCGNGMGQAGFTTSRFPLHQQRP